MAFCPKCLTEYAGGSAKCVDCQLPLKAGLPPDRKALANEPAHEADVKLVKIRTFSGLTAALDAELARNILEAEGIPCALPGEGHAEMLPGLDLVQLLVREEDVNRATEVLISFLDNPPIPPAEEGPTPSE